MGIGVSQEKRLLYIRWVYLPRQRRRSVSYVEQHGVYPTQRSLSNQKTANPLKQMLSRSRSTTKENSSKIRMGHAGIGSASHICSLMFMHALDIKLTLVPYKGAAPAIKDLMGLFASGAIRVQLLN